MIICFDCKRETKEQLDALVASGDYRHYGEVITAAVANLLLLQKAVVPKGSVVFESNAAQSARTDQSVPAPRSAAPREGNRGVQKSRKPASRVKKTHLTVKTRKAKPTPAEAGRELKPPLTDLEMNSWEKELERDDGGNGVPAIFAKLNLPKKPPKGLADLPADMWAVGQEVPLDRWVLGQFNRLLPAKVNARALIRMYAETTKGLGISETAEYVAAQAVKLTEYLARLDSMRGSARDDSLATAFPIADEDNAKSRTRYATQFVVYQNSKGELSGLMIDLKLINVRFNRRERRIIPTQAAWEFAALDNPVLDGDGNGAARRFSEEEESYLIDHILRGVPVEAFAYWAILNAVRDGHNVPDKLDAALKRYVSPDRAGDLSQSFLASQRSGAVSRMSDLNLIERHRDGVRVAYSVTNNGDLFLNRYAERVKAHV